MASSTEGMKEMTALIYDTEHLNVIAGGYKTEKMAQRALKNTQELGWKLQGRRVSSCQVERLSVATVDQFRNEIDHDVVVYSVMGGKPVTIKKSQQGSSCDPSTERYWSM
jgi:hypothetical protein